MHTSNDALIIGAGIAGPALALALQRVGISSAVYESSSTPRDDAGAFLNLAPNGLAVLRALDVEYIAQDLGFQNDRLVFHSDTDRVLADVAVGGVTIMRGALSYALREAALDAGIRFEMGKALHSVEERDQGVLARFTDGTTATGCMLVGTDGIHSRTRSSYFPEAPRPTYTGIINLGGIVQTSLPETGPAMHMVFGRRAFFGYAVRPSGSTYWFSNFAQSDEPEPGASHVVSTERVRQKLLDVHRDDPEEVATILDAISNDVGAYAVYDLMSIPRWQRGRVCLIGDAAHALGPHVGQGASLALEDAFVLAKCLRDVADPSVAFASFERMRRDRVERIVRQSRRTGKQKAPSGWFGRKIRDLVLPVFLRNSARGAAWMYDYPIDWEDRVASSAA